MMSKDKSEHERITDLEHFVAKWKPVLNEVEERVLPFHVTNMPFIGAAVSVSAGDWEAGKIDKCDDNQEEIYFTDGPQGGCVTVNIDIRNYGPGTIQPRYNGNNYGEALKPPGEGEEYNSKVITIKCRGPHSVKLHSTEGKTRVEWRTR